jgi:hypothetical protein
VPVQLTHFTDRSINIISWSSIPHVPEPGTLSLLILGGLSIGGRAAARRPRVRKP